MTTAPTVVTAGRLGSCAHCGGAMQSVTPSRLPEFKRCTSCGRDDRGPAPSNGTTNAAAGSSPCTVDGCPGVVVAGRCACCEKRAKWAEDNMPKRRCGICEGPVFGKGGRKYCPACAPIAQKVQTAKNKAPVAGTKP